MSDEVVQRLLENLQTHQAELEAQNDVLRISQTELSRAHNKYAELYNFAPVGFAAISKKGLCEQSNLTLEEMVGLDRNELVGQPFSIFIDPVDQDRFYCAFRTLNRENTQLQIECRLRNGDMESFWIHMKIAFREAADEENSYCLCAITDISQQKKAEEDRVLIEGKMLPAQKLESLGVLAAGIAHDFNNILVAIQGNAGLAKDELPQHSPARQYITEVEVASSGTCDCHQHVL